LVALLETGDDALAGVRALFSYQKSLSSVESSAEASAAAVA